jgi:ankyrin repeat protein
MSLPTTAPPDVEDRPVAVWLVVALVGMLLLAGLALIVARKGATWGIKSETLHTAAVHWPEEIVPLIRSGRDVNELMLGRTALHQAVTFGKVDSVRWLLQHGADPNLYDPSGTTSPAVAGSGVHASGDPPDGPPLGSAHLHLRNPEDRAIILLLLDAGADPDTPGTFGETLLHKAARVKFHRLAQRLLDLGADVNAQNDRGETPLHEAAKAYDSLLVDTLLQAGADPSIGDERGRTAADDSAARHLDESLQKRLQQKTP